MRRPDLPPKLVQSFLTVLQMQSYTQAAHALNLTQPAVTQHISRLEEIVGVRLIERSRGVVLPTAEAQALMPELERFEQSAKLLFDKARAVAEGGRNSLQIATPTSLVAHLLVPAITELRRSGTGVFPVFREVDDHRVYDMVRAGEVDFALTSMTGSDTALSCTFLLSDRPCVVCLQDHPLASTGSVSIEDILPFELIRPPADTSANRTIGIFEKTLQAEFTYAAEASRLMTMETMARAGLGVLILPALSAQLSAHTDLVFRPIDTEKGWRSCQLIRQKHLRPSPVAKQVMEGVQSKVRALEMAMPDLLARHAPPGSQDRT